MTEKTSLRVLVAEDNPVNQQVAAGLVRHLGHEVEVVADGHMAFELAAGGGYDLILMDVQMPEMDGLDATRAIRALPAPAGQVPILAMTADSGESDMGACFAAGMNDFLKKPLDRPMLQAMLARWGGGREPARDPAVLDDLRQMLGADRVAKIVALFLRDGAMRIERMQAAVKIGDLAEIGRHAHSLAGAASEFGLIELTERCRRLSQDSHGQPNAPIVAAEIAAIGTCFERMREYL